MSGDKKPRDLGLTYEEAAHGVQSATAFEQSKHGSQSGSPKHLRTGINMAMADHAALVQLLMDRGIITNEEYLEALRLWANEELARHQDLHPGVNFR